jgi:carbon monoxide dehydrogenase subunit G
MPHAQYQFITQWQIPAPLERVWNVLNAPDQWPQWWRGVERVELIQKAIDDLGTGAIRRYTWKSRLPYRLSFVMETTRIEPPHRIEGQATGELQGRGVWQLAYANGVTHVQYDWAVNLNKLWMQLITPIARPLFEWNHDIVMEWGRQGLLSRLGIASS